MGSNPLRYIRKVFYSTPLLPIAPGLPLLQLISDLSTNRRQPDTSLCWRSDITHMIVSRGIADVAVLELSTFPAFQLGCSQPGLWLLTVHMQRHEDSFTFRPYLQRDLAPFIFFPLSLYPYFMLFWLLLATFPRKWVGFYPLIVLIMYSCNLIKSFILVFNMYIKILTIPEKTCSRGSRGLQARVPLCLICTNRDPPILLSF